MSLRNLWHRTSSNRARDERGEGALQVIIGAVVITTIVGGFIGFYFNSDDSARENADRTTQQAAAVQVLNRVGRDIESADRVIEASPREVVIERPASGTQVERIYYGVAPAGDGFELVTRNEVVASNSGYDPAAAWTPENVLGRRLTDESKFEFFTSNGTVTSTPGQVGRVDTTYVASAADGAVRLATSSAVKTATGGGGGGLTAAGPTAANDAGTVVLDPTTLTGTVAVPIGSNDTCAGNPCSSGASWRVDTGDLDTGVSVGPNPSASGTMTVSIADTYAAPAVGSSNTTSFPYTLTHGGQSVSATVTVTVQNPAAAAGDFPVAVDDTVYLVRGGPSKTVDLFANDTNLTGASATTSAVPAGVSVTPTATEGTIRVAATAGFANTTGRASFTYTVVNSGGGTDTALVNVVVIDAVNDPSVTVPYRNTTTTDVFVNDIAATYTDIRTNGGTVSVDFDDLRNGVTGSFADSTGVVTLRSGNSSTAGAGAGSFEYTITSPDGDTDSAVVPVRVGPDVPQTPLNLRAYPSQPMSAATTVGSNLISWNGTTGPYTVEFSTNNGGSWSAVPGSPTTATSLTHSNVPLASNYLYRVTDSQPVKQVETNSSLQFPDRNTVTALGSNDTGATSGLATSAGSNRLTWPIPADAGVETPRTVVAGAAAARFDAARSAQASSAPAGKPTVNGAAGLARFFSYERREFVSRVDDFGSGAIEEKPAQTAVTTDSNAGRCTTVDAKTLCAEDTGNAGGTERIYQIVTFTNCDTDLPAAAVTRSVSGAKQCASPEHFGAPVSYAGAAKAYQAPTEPQAAMTVTAGNATAVSACKTGHGSVTVNSTTFTATDANNFYSCSLNDGLLAWTTAPDHGQPDGAKFCSYSQSTACASRYAKDSGATAPAPTTVANSTLVEPPTGQKTVYATGWGGRDTYAVTGCNPGGCNATPKTTFMLSFPAPFAVDSFEMPTQKFAADLTSVERIDRRASYSTLWFNGAGCWVKAGCQADKNTPEAKVGWSESKGATNYVLSSTKQGGSAAAMSKSGLNFSYDGSARNSGWQKVYDATLYRVAVDAWISKSSADLGRSRRAVNDVFTAPPQPSLVQDAAFCAPSINGAWKYGVAYRAEVRDENGEPLNPYVSGFRGMIWAGRVNTGETADKIGVKAANDWLKGDGAHDANGNKISGWPTPAQWNGTGARAYKSYKVTNTANFGTQNYTTMMGGDSASDSTKTLPSDPWDGRITAGHIRYEAYTKASDAGLSPGGLADLTSYHSDDYEGEIGGNEARARSATVETPAVNDCNGGGGDSGHLWNPNQSGPTAWRAIQNGASVTRRAHEKIPGFTTPDTQFWNKIPGF